MRASAVMLSLVAACHFDVSGVDVSFDVGVVVVDAGEDLAVDAASQIDLAVALDLSVDSAIPDLLMIPSGSDLSTGICLSACTACGAGQCCIDSRTSSNSDNSIACPTGCGCTLMATGTHDNSLSCSSDGQCQLIADNTHNDSLSCGAGATCQLRCTDSHSCIMNCGAGASCLVQCTNVTNTCNINNCLPTSCPNGVKVCGRSCP